MSCDLAFFTYRDGLTLQDVGTAYRRACEGESTDDGVTDATLADFVAALEQQYPQLSALKKEQLDDSPWSCDFDLGPRHLIICMRFSKAEEVSTFILQLLSTYPLVLYDPQSDKAFISDQQLV